MAQDKVLVMVKEPSNAKEVEREIPNDFTAIQDIVGGYFERYGHEELGDIHIYCDELGAMREKKQNIWMENIGFGGTWIVGTVVFAKTDDDGNYVSLTDKDKKKITKFLWE